MPIHDDYGQHGIQLPDLFGDFFRRDRRCFRVDHFYRDALLPCERCDQPRPHGVFDRRQPAPSD